MRFPNDMLPPARPVVDATEVTPKAAVTPVRPIGTGMRGTSAHLGVRHEVEEEEAKPDAYSREGDDRRKMCRRIYHLPVLLDTRSGEERRKEVRRDDDIATHLSEEA